MAGINDFPGFIGNIVKGDTRDFVITVKRDGAPIDITGAKFVITFDVDKDASTDPVLEITIDPPTDPTNGKTTGRIPADQTILFDVGTMFYSVRYINSDGVPYVIDMGKIKILPNVSEVIS